MNYLKECLKKIIIIIRLWEADTKEENGEHEIIVNNGNRVNQFINNVEPNSNSYFNELINLTDTIIICKIQNWILFTRSRDEIL